MHSTYRYRLIFVCVLIPLCLLTIQSQTGAQETSPPADYRQLPDITILGDSRLAMWGGGGNGITLELDESGQIPLVSGEYHNDSPVYRLSTTAEPGTYGWWLLLLAGYNWEAYGITPYLESGALEMNVRLETGTEEFGISLRDIVRGREPFNVESNIVNISDYTTSTTGWQSVRIPLSDLIDSNSLFNTEQMFTVGFVGTSPDGFTAEINQVRFTANGIESESPLVKLNQLGYTPNGSKSAIINRYPEDLVAEEGTVFEIRRVDSDAVVFTGQLSERSPFDPVASGEKVLEANFDALKDPGSYYLALDGTASSADSPTFEIGSDIYGDLLFDSMKYYYLQRAGVDIEAAYAGEYARPAGHLQDQSVSLQSGLRSGIDVSGGWYDAGDYGKYVNAGATAVSDLLWAWEMFPDRFSDSQFNIPESGNGVPDLLDELRWELEWMLKMQDPSSGGFYHMVQPTQEVSPADATETRYIDDQEGTRTNIRPTSTTGSAVAILAHAAFVFDSIDPSFAATMQAAAEAGWVYLEANPSGVIPMEGPYSDKIDSDNRFWAATALYRLTGERAYHDYIKAEYASVETFFDSLDDNAYGVNDMGMVAWLTYLHSSNRDPLLISHFETLFGGWADHMTARWNSSLWGHTLLDEDYYWGSNYVVLTTPLVLYVAADGLGDQSLKLTASAISQTGLDYLLGTNPLSFSYLSGYGERSVANLYSVQWSSDNVPLDPPGVLVGGPNAYTNPLLYSNFAAKRYIDSNISWSLNEQAIYWNSIIVFHAAMQADETDTYHSLAEDQWLAIDLLGEEKGALDITSLTQPAIGSSAIISGDIHFSPPANWHGSTAFSYVISDGTHQTEPIIANVTVNPTVDSGDVTCDEPAPQANTVDAFAILQYSVGLRSVVTECPLSNLLSDIYLPNCDVDGDQTCRLSDALFILQCSVGIENAFCPSGS